MSKIPVISIKELSDPHTRAELHRVCEEWGFYDKELTKNVRDRKEIFDHGPRLSGVVTPWPEAMPVLDKL